MPSPDHISFVTPTLTFGGFERVWTKLANELAARGHTVDLVAVNAHGEFVSEVSPDVNLVDLDQPGVLKSVPALTRYVRSEHPDAIVSGLDHMNLVATWATLLARAPTKAILTIHNIPSDEHDPDRQGRGVKERVIPRLMQLTYPFADGISAISRDSARDVAHVANIPEEDVEIIPNAVVDDALLSAASEPVTHDWFTDTESPVVLGAGRLEPLKGFSVLIDAATHFRDDGVKFVIIGEGPERETLESQIQQLDLEDTVDLPGYVSNPYKYMKAADVFCLPSRSEGLGNSLIEAISVGTPAIATACSSGPVSILEGGDLGPIVEPDDATGMANAIQEVLASPVSSEELISKSKEYSVQTVADEYLEFINNVN